jgi:hypothetical protein
MARTTTGYPCLLVTDKDAPLADPAADWWTMDDVAAYLGIAPESARRYRSRPLTGGGLPKEDRMFGRTPAWKPATIIDWKRPGQGARSDLNEPPAP